jgi:hypothetical protein
LATLSAPAPPNPSPVAEHVARLSAAKATKAIFTADIDMLRLLIFGESPVAWMRPT